MDGMQSGKLIRLPDGPSASALGRNILAIDPDGWESEEVGTLPSTPREWMMLSDELIFIHETSVCLGSGFALTHLSRMS